MFSFFLSFHSFTSSFFHSFTHSFIHSFIFHSFVSFIHSFVWEDCAGESYTPYWPVVTSVSGKGIDMRAHLKCYLYKHHVPVEPQTYPPVYWEIKRSFRHLVYGSSGERRGTKLKESSKRRTNKGKEDRAHQRRSTELLQGGEAEEEKPVQKLSLFLRNSDAAMRKFAKRVGVPCHIEPGRDACVRGKSQGRAGPRTRQEATIPTLGFLGYHAQWVAHRRCKVERQNGLRMLEGLLTLFLEPSACGEEALIACAAAGAGMCSERASNGVCTHLQKVGLIIH